MATDPNAEPDSKPLSGLDRTKRRIARKRSVAGDPAAVGTALPGPAASAPVDEDDDGASDWERLFAGQRAAVKQGDATTTTAGGGAAVEEETVNDPAAAPEHAEVEEHEGAEPEAVAAPAGVVPEPSPGRRRSAVRPVGAALLVVLLAASTSVAVLQWRRADRLANTEAVRRTIALTSGDFSLALLTYDYTNLDAARSRVLSMATESFAQNYTNAFTNGLSAAITQLKAKSAATVRKVFVTDVTGNNADAVVIIDSEVHSTAGTRQVVGSYMELNLLRLASGWKVNQVTSIAASSSNLTPSPATPGAPSAGSTAPSTPSTTAAPSPGG